MHFFVYSTSTLYISWKDNCNYFSSKQFALSNKKLYIISMYSTDNANSIQLKTCKCKSSLENRDLFVKNYLIINDE